MLEDPEGEGSSDPPSFRLQPALGFPHRKHGTEDRHLKFYELWDNLGVSALPGLGSFGKVSG